MPALSSGAAAAPVFARACEYSASIADYERVLFERRSDGVATLPLKRPNRLNAFMMPLEHA